ncbi:peptide ABC transporter permease [Anaerobacillus alkalilacustris]|uniref:Peptide ABC transporter permease n=1 Tax=Anaerobacillus alkalilacustris TaxID=393763 RepID=A0A1S2LYW5_9BACI|nr:anti-sigma-F factor Fin family protein [Anaerobacillus alkalilacustris]OIJ17546.1 peptide ABC transporter permease [Anaerobacillus alkalilacustris]
MTIHYQCRHCGISVGKIEQNQIEAQKLGFHQLDQSERTEMIRYDETGDIHVDTICEDCQEALERNPHFHENQTFIQ